MSPRCSLRRLRFLSLASTLFLAISCGGGDGPATEPPVSMNVGQAGARIEGPGGVMVVVPAGATDTDTLITVSQIPQASPPPGTAVVAIPIRLEPAGKTFEQPVEVVVDIPPGSVPSGMAITDIVVMRSPKGANDFTPLPTRVAGPASVAAVTEHFSDYIAIVVVEEALDPLGTCDDAICDANLGEDCASCPGDCGLCFTATEDICGDFTCGTTESCIDCPYDCACASVCDYYNGGCGNGASCEDLGGYPACTCPVGTEDAYGDGTVCTTSGGCTAGVCGQGYCNDYGDGSYYCECPDGYGGLSCDATYDPCVDSPCINGWCVPVDEVTVTCACPGEWEGTYCEVDVDECATQTANCDPNAVCTNLDGSYECACDVGYTGDGFTCTAADPDECALGTHTCDVNAICTDENPGFSCACDVGYAGDGFVCDPI